MEATATFDYYNGETMPIRENLVSIFDSRDGGNIDTKGKYYILMSTHTNFGVERYCITPKNYEKFYTKGRRLKENEVDRFWGAKVTGMSEWERYQWDMDMLDAEVDIWGNIRYYNEEDYNDEFDCQE